MRRRSGSAPATGGSASRRAAARPLARPGARTVIGSSSTSPTTPSRWWPCWSGCGGWATPVFSLAVGHRIVHGGDRYREPQRVAPEVVADLRARYRSTPTTSPGDRGDRGRRAGRSPRSRRWLASTPPSTAGCPASPGSTRFRATLAEEGVVRYGFHGLSYEYIMQELRALDRDGGRRPRRSSRTWATGRAWPPSATASASTRPWASPRPAGW